MSDPAKAHDLPKPHVLEYWVDWPSVKDRPHLFLGEAITWIVSRGEKVRREVTNYLREDPEADAERALFERLDAHGQRIVEGYLEGGKRAYRKLPAGLWARMNRGGQQDPTFSPVDDVEGRDDGGCVRSGNRMWNGVRLPASFVFAHWPPAAQQRRGRRPKFNWEAFNSAASAKLDHEGALNPAIDPKFTRGSLERFMAEWCRKTWGTEPAESTIRLRLAAVIDAKPREGR